VALAFVGASALLSCARAYAESISVVAVGEFASHYDPDGLLPFSEPTPGTTFTLEFTYESTAPDMNPDAGDFYQGFYAIGSISLTIGDELFPPLGVQRIYILHLSEPGVGGDTWRAETFSVHADNRLETFYMRLHGACAPEGGSCPLTSDALVPPTWPYTSAEIAYSINDLPNESAILAKSSANVMSLTAIPLLPTALLLPTAFAAVAWRVRRRAAA